MVTHLRLEHRWTQLPDYVSGFVEFNGWLEPRTTVYVDLSLSESELLMQMKYNGRSRVRTAINKGVTVVEDTSTVAVTDFLMLYHGTMDRKGLESMNTDYHRDLVSTLVKHGAGSLYFAEFDGQRVATALVVYWGERATYFFAG